MDTDMEAYSVLFVNVDGLFQLTIKNGVRKMNPVQLEKLKALISKTHCTIVPQRYAQLEAEATSTETGLDIMRLMISLAHEALPISVETFKRATSVCKLNTVVSVLKLLRFSPAMKDGFRAQGRFIYKMKNEITRVVGCPVEGEDDAGDVEYVKLFSNTGLEATIQLKREGQSIYKLDYFHQILGSDENNADGSKYTDVLSYVGSEATMQLKDESWSSTSQTKLNIFRSIEKVYFSVSSGRRLEVIEENSEPSFVVLKYFQRYGPKYPPILHYDQVKWDNEGEDPGLIVVLHLLDLIYSGKNPVNFQKIICF